MKRDNGAYYQNILYFESRVIVHSYMHSHLVKTLFVKFMIFWWLYLKIIFHGVQFYVICINKYLTSKVN